jgi:Domain of unknown function (DUF397)
MAISNLASLGELSWRVAQRCNSGDCIRIAPSGDMVLIGDSKDPDGPVLAYSRSDMRGFLDGIRRGDFDDMG